MPRENIVAPRSNVITPRENAIDRQASSGRQFVDGGGGGGGGGDFIQSQTVTRTAGNYTSNSTSFADVTGMSITMTTGAHRCLISVGCCGFASEAADPSINLTVDGASQGQTFGLMVRRSGVTSVNWSFSFLTGVLSAASHTFRLQARTTAGDVTLYASTTAPLILSVMELDLTA